MRIGWCGLLGVLCFHAMALTPCFGDEKPKKAKKEESAADSIDSTDDLYRRAAELALQGKYAEAIPFYEKLLKRPPEFDGDPPAPGWNAMMYFDYASCQYFAGKYREALETCRIAEAKHEQLRSIGEEPDLHNLLVVRIRIFQCLRELKSPESVKELREFDRLFADYQGEHRDKFVQWRSGIKEPLSLQK